MRGKRGGVHSGTRMNFSTQVGAPLVSQDVPVPVNGDILGSLPPISMKRPPIDYGAANGGQYELSRIAGFPKET